jgi:hypothetical protein
MYQLINKNYFISIFILIIIFLNDFYILNINFASISAILILIIISAHYTIKKKIFFFIENKQFLIYQIIFFLLLLSSFYSAYTFSNFDYYFLRPGNIVKAIIFSLIGYIYFSKLQIKSIKKIIIIIAAFHFINLVIFFSCNSPGKIICSTNDFFNSLFLYLLSFSKNSTSWHGHFPFYNQTTYYWLIFVTLYFSLFIFKNKFFSATLFAISCLKIQSLYDTSSYLIAFLIIIIFFFIKKKNFFFNVIIIAIFFSSPFVTNYKYFFTNDINEKKIIEERILNPKEIFNNPLLTPHKINLRYKEILAIKNCLNIKKFNQSFRKTDFKKTDFYLCLQDNQIVNYADNDLFFHNIILNILIISNVHILLIVIFCVLLLAINLGKINHQLLIIPFIAMTMLITDGFIFICNSMWIFIGYNFHVAKRNST